VRQIYEGTSVIEKLSFNGHLLTDSKRLLRRSEDLPADERVTEFEKAS
jgi:hypothetical protein